ncbi:hypothetical protein [Micromonospora sp. ATA51]
MVEVKNGYGRNFLLRPRRREGLRLPDEEIR